MQQQAIIWGHPKGLFVLFFTELWERFSFYGMRAILVLYLTQQTTGDNPGMGWTSKEALALYGWYGMMVYFMGIFGGVAADKWLGQKKSVFVGGIFIILGQFSMAIEGIIFGAVLGLLWSMGSKAVQWFLIGEFILLKWLESRNILVVDWERLTLGIVENGNRALDEVLTLAQSFVDLGAFGASTAIGFFLVQKIRS